MIIGSKVDTIEYSSFSYCKNLKKIVIPDNVKYITAMPQMRKYMKVSAEIYSVYLNYISPDDIYVYSIDECFIDVTDYCRLYKKLREKLPLCL